MLNASIAAQKRKYRRDPGILKYEMLDIVTPMDAKHWLNGSETLVTV
jgi:hypothetical protein